MKDVIEGFRVLLGIAHINYLDVALTSLLSLPKDMHENNKNTIDLACEVVNITSGIKDISGGITFDQIKKH